MREAVLVDMVRTPFGRAGQRGVFRDITHVDLVVPLMKALLERNNVAAEEVDEILMEHPAVVGSGAEQAGQHLIGDREVVDHEGLEGRDAAPDQLGQLVQRVALLAGDDRAQAVVDRRLSLGALDELIQASQE